MIPLNRPFIGREEKEFVMAVLESGQLAAGEQVRRFEAAFAGFLGARCAVATNNGTSALQVALLAAGIKPGDRVITTPFTFGATAAAIVHCGAIPVFADIDPRTLNLCPDSVYARIKEVKPAAILPVHLFGTPCEMDRFLELAERYRLLLVEDCAQAHGAVYYGRNVGTIGCAAAFSFYATKNMTTGEGGMVVTSDEEVDRRARLLIHQGSPGKYKYSVLGHNFRMTEIAAAIGLAQLEKLPAFTKARQKNASMITECLASVKNTVSVYVPPGVECVYHHYTVLSEHRDELRDHMEQCGVQCGICYPVPLHRFPVFQSAFGGTNLPHAEKACHHVLSVPVHPGLRPEDLQTICGAFKSFNKNQ